MPRLSAALLLAALTALASWGAPAPLPKPGDWFAGWDKPIDPRGDCRFERIADRLTITVPGKGHVLDVLGRRLNAARLLRVVRGNFVAQVRLGGMTHPTARSGCYQAGLLLTDGKLFIKVQRYTKNVEGYHPRVTPYTRTERSEVQGGRSVRYHDLLPFENPDYLRLVRRGQTLRVEFSEDGTKWIRMRPTVHLWLPKDMPAALRVGVLAESSAAGTFKPTFDQFKVSRLPK
jgi:regulation of enolase protein 1 (concanavalin A-like superfamily)